MGIHHRVLASAAVAASLQLAGCAAPSSAPPAAGASGMSAVSEGPAASPQGGVPAGAVILSGTCNAQAAGYAVGRPATESLQSELVTRTLAKTLRIKRPGEAVTQEFSSQRLNLQVDSAGYITAVTCG